MDLQSCFRNLKVINNCKEFTSLQNTKPAIIKVTDSHIEKCWAFKLNCIKPKEP